MRFNLRGRDAEEFGALVRHYSSRLRLRTKMRENPVCALDETAKVALGAVINYGDLLEIAVSTKKNVDSTGGVIVSGCLQSPSGASDEKDALTAFHGKKH
jgi:hypothetical protein